MVGLIDYTPGLNKTWPCDFDGPGIILVWGGGESGASGEALTRGGKGGDSGWLCVGLQNFDSTATYEYTIGAGGALVNYVTGAGFPGNPGEDSYFGGGATVYAPGGGSSGTAQGIAQIPGGIGEIPASGNWIGGDGAGAPSQGEYHGGAGGINNTQGLGTVGAAPGGGGSGGGQSGAGDGQTGGDGGIIIVPAPDASQPGRHLVGMDEDYTFWPSGQFDDYTADADGIPIFEGVGSGGGGKGGLGSFAQGGHSGSGGAWMWVARPVFKGVTYRANRPVGGVGGNYNFSSPTSGTDGADASWTLTPRSVISKRLSSNVAFLTTSLLGSSSPKKHGLLLGESVVITNVDATFNGTFTVTRVDSALDYSSGTTYAIGDRVNTSTGDVYVSIQASNTNHTPSSSPTYWLLTKPDRLAVGYTKTASNVSPTSVTPTTTTVSLSAPFLVAKGGLGATGSYTSGTPKAGGSAAAGTPSGQGTNGDRGQVCQDTTPPNSRGANAGGGALPLGAQGGWGGGFVLAAGTPGDPGQIPGGGGGGGRGSITGNGGDGADGAAVVRWIFELHGLWLPGDERVSVVRVTAWTGSPGSEVGHTIITPTIWDGPSTAAVFAHDPTATMVHPESKKRRYPEYLVGPGYDYTAYFDRDSGTFNWLAGVGSRILDSFASGDFDMIVFGDSVAEGWTSFDGLATGIKDFPKAYPRFTRDLLTLSASMTKGGTGFIRTNTLAASTDPHDPMWTLTGWSSSGDLHYITSSTVAHVATFTPASDTGAANGGTPQQITGDHAAIIYSGGGITVKNAGGTTIGTGAATGSNSTLARLEINLGSVAGHVIKINPTTTTQVCLFGADVYKTGIRVHDVAQGGSKAGGGTGQTYWGPASGMTAPSNMTACYTQDVMISSTKSRADVWVIGTLGGNDSNAGTSANDIKDAFERVVDMIQAAEPDAPIVLMPDVWTADRVLALMELCLSKDVAMMDFYYKSRALTSIFGLNYNGDQFGHLNATTGAPWAGAMLETALLYNPI